MRKFLSIMLAAVCSLSVLAGCGGGGGGGGTNSDTITIWCAEQDTAFVAARLAQFVELKPDVDIRIVPKGEPDVAGALMGDAEASADLFYFPDDKLVELVNGGFLYDVGTYRQKLETDNLEGFIQAATVGGKLYAFPKSADNTYYLYYDKGKAPNGFTTVNELLAATDTNKLLRFDYGNSWYGSSWFFTAGGTIGLDGDNKLVTTFGESEVVDKVYQLASAFTAPGVKGLSTTAENGDIIAGFTAGNTLAAVSGPWNYEALKEVLSDNLGMQALPAFTFAGESTPTPMRSFAGYKMLGINSAISSPAKISMVREFADFLSNEQGQMLMLQMRSYAPCNLKVAASSEAQGNDVVKVVSDQFMNSNIQRDAIGNYWTGVEGVVAEVKKNGLGNKDDFIDLVNNAVEVMLESAFG